MLGFSRSSTTYIRAVGTPLTTVTRLPDTCWAEWLLVDGSRTWIAITPAVYLAVQAGALPTNTTGDPGAVCVSCESRPAYTTGTGRLGPGHIADFAEGAGWFNRDGDDPAPPRLMIGTSTRTFGVPAADISGSTANPSGLSVRNTRRTKVDVIAGLLIEGL